MNTGSFKPIFITIIIPYNKKCKFFKNFKKTSLYPPHSKKPHPNKPKKIWSRYDSIVFIKPNLFLQCSKLQSSEPIDTFNWKSLVVALGKQQFSYTLQSREKLLTYTVSS